MRYENAGGTNPSVTAYVRLRNRAEAPFPLKATTFEGSTLTGVSGVPVVANTYTFPRSTRPGEEDVFSERNLPTEGTILIALRFATMDHPPSGFILRMFETPPIRLPGQRRWEGNVTIPPYSGEMPASRHALPQPQAPLNGGREVAAGPPDFKDLGPFRVRADSVMYGSVEPRPDGATGKTGVGFTIQNITEATIPFARESFILSFEDTRGHATRADAGDVELRHNGVRVGSDQTVSLRPGDFLTGEATVFLADTNAQLRVKQTQFTYRLTNGLLFNSNVEVPAATLSVEPSPTPSPGPAPSSTAIQITGAPTIAVDPWRMNIVSIDYGATEGTSTTVVATIRNAEPTPQTLTTGQIVGELFAHDGTKIPSDGPVRVVNKGNPLGNGVSVMIQPGETVQLHSTHATTGLPQQQQIVRWSMRKEDAPRAHATFDVPQAPGGAPLPAPQPQAEPTPPPAPPPPPGFDPPADPAPNPGAEASLRALAGEYSVNATDLMTLTYQDGLLLGEIRPSAGQPASATLKLTIDQGGLLKGVMNRADQPPHTTWYALSLAAADGTLSGTAAFVHVPSNSPTQFRARRTGPASAAQTPTPPVAAPTQTPAPAANAGTDVSRFSGQFTTSRGTVLTLSAQGDRLTGRASGENQQARENLTLRSSGNGAFTGNWSEMTASGMEMGRVSLQFTEGRSFSGTVQYTMGGQTGQSVAYSGQRGTGQATGGAGTPPPAQTPPPAPTSATGTGDFQTTAWMDMRVDRVGRSSLGGIEVVFTARNSADERRGIQYNQQRPAVVGSNGLEYGWDGNHYGESSANRLVETVWLNKDGQGKVTYLFPQVPANVTPVRLIFREYGQQTAAFELPR